jgi:hypothetical protein
MKEDEKHEDEEEKGWRKLWTKHWREGQINGEKEWKKNKEIFIRVQKAAVLYRHLAFRHAC